MRKLILLLTLVVLPFLAGAQTFKKIGYLPYYRFSWINDIEFSRLSHVNIAFVNPVDTAGNLSCGGVSITNAVQKAKLAGCEVFACIGGGYLTPEQDAAWDHLAEPANRAAFIQKILAYLQAHNLDGVDIDLEWQYVKDWYSPFVLDLKAVLEPLGYPLTAALPGSYRYPKITNPALEAFDWVNMMIYDLKGPWDPSNPGQHAPFWWAEDCITYWLGQNVPASKLTLGMPFYGYDFGQSPVTAYSYRYVVTQDTANAWTDQTAEIYYNGIPTIRAKTELAKSQSLGGVMIWELGQDAFGDIKEYSLLKAIDEAAAPVSATANLVDVHRLQLYPNPTQDGFSISGNAGFEGQLMVYNTAGQLVLSQTLQGSRPYISVSSWPAGLYQVAVVAQDNMIWSGRLMRN